jgi:hypothetical protein
MDAPEASRNCSPSLRVATANEFALSNVNKLKNFIIGELVGAGEVSFIVENLPKDGTGCPGWWMFNKMMEHFGSRVTAVQGNWFGAASDNMTELNQRTASGMSIEQSAPYTKTGRYAKT